jgi:hypothetical protein
MSEADRALCAATARLLRAARVAGAWGLALSVIAIAVLALTGRSLPMLSATIFGAVALAGMLERYFTFRLYFDAGLFGDLASGTIASLGDLDSALQRLGLRPAADRPRALEDRVAGARRLLQCHGIAVACQSGLFLLALLVLDLR